METDKREKHAKMNTEEKTLVSCMDDLHAFNILDERIVNLISANFGVDAKEICEKYGITYDIY